ncbi:MAG: S-methyl-5'-thioadenosine phosphorylase, partial [Anaerolineae bacterium]
VGSLREDYAPLDIVIPDQLIDRTRMRPNTFFGDGLVGHISFADPFCPELSGVLYASAQQSGAIVHNGGTFVVMEGPAFSTKAESRIYRQWGADIIGMTALPEAKLAREAEICYAAIAMVTDYDVWYESHGSVTVDMVVQNLLRNAETGKTILRTAIPKIPAERTTCPCHSALKDALITNPAFIPPATRQTLDLLIGKYMPK